MPGDTLSSARWALGLRPPLLAEDKDDDLAPSQEAKATTKLPQPEGTFESQLTLAELGMNLDDTGAAMEADYEMGALTMQSLGLNLYDLEEPHVVDAPEDIAERLGRIMNTFGKVGASADFVLVSNAMEPDSSIRQPTLGSAPRVQYTTAAGAPDTISDDDDGGEKGDTEVLEVEDEREVPGYSLRPPPRESGLEARRAQRTPRQQVEDRVPPTARGVMSSDSPLQKNEINLGDLGLDLRDLSEGIARDSPRLRPRPRDSGLEAQRAQWTSSQQVEGRVHPANRGIMSSDLRDSHQNDDINLGDLGLDLRDLSEGVVRDSPRSDALKLDDLGLELDDVAVGVDNIDDSVLALAQQLVKENVL